MSLFYQISKFLEHSGSHVRCELLIGFFNVTVFAKGVKVSNVYNSEVLKK